MQGPPGQAKYPRTELLFHFETRGFGGDQNASAILHSYPILALQIGKQRRLLIVAFFRFFLGGDDVVHRHLIALVRSVV